MGLPVRDAATVVLVRRTARGPEVLMGQRAASAVFMPDKLVFPGGAVDEGDFALGQDWPLDPATARRLAEPDRPELAPALALAAIRELWEETSLLLARPGHRAATGAPACWKPFLATGVMPHTAGLRLIFRAVTPPGRPRRFDARFFLAEAEDLIAGDTAPCGEELHSLAWLDLQTARSWPLPFITEVVLAELEELLAKPGDAPLRPVPFFHHDAAGAHVTLL